MAYFSNGSEGTCFDNQCGRCKYGDKPCPIALVQMEYNYNQNEHTAIAAILDILVKNDGTCSMFKLAQKDLARTSVEDDKTLIPTNLLEEQKVVLFKEAIDRYSIEELEYILK